MFPGFPDAAPQQPEQPESLPNRILAALEPIIQLLNEDGQVDEQERVVIESFRTDLMKILADRQKQADGMLAGKMEPRAVRRMA